MGDDKKTDTVEPMTPDQRLALMFIPMAVEVLRNACAGPDKELAASVRAALIARGIKPPPEKTEP